MSMATPTQGVIAALLHDTISDWSASHPNVRVDQDARDLVESLIAVADAREAAHALRGAAARGPEAAANLKRLLDASVTAQGFITYDDIIKGLSALCPLYPFC